MKPLALVTGAASGLGLEFARLLAADLYDLVMVDSDREGLHRVKDELEQEFGISVETHMMDLGQEGAALAVWSVIGQRRIDVLINNAGFGLYGLFSETHWQKEESMLYLHVMTVTHLTKLVLRQMLDRGAGRILNVSSLAAFQPGPLMSVYYASKAYILSLSGALANEVKGTGVTVTVLAPGWFRTNFQKTIATISGVEESKARLHTATAGKVARKGYNAMMKGKAYVIPGFVNKLMAFVPRILPRRTSTNIVRFIQDRIRKKQAQITPQRH
jgi:short-subunit dehydrogenase